MEGNKQLSSMRRRSKKRTFHGNKHTNIGGQQTTLQEEESGGAISESSTDINTSKSASASKIDLSSYDVCSNSSQEAEIVDPNVQETPTTSNIDIQSMYLFADVRILFNLFSLIGKCPKCNSAIDCEIDFPNKRGLAQKVVLTCDGTNDKDCD